MEELVRRYTFRKFGPADKEAYGLFLDFKFEDVLRNAKYFDEEELRKSPVKELESKIRNTESKEDTFLFGLSCLETFVAENWSIPSGTPVESILPWLNSQNKPILIECLLKDGGESVLGNAVLPELLAVANVILVDNRSHFKEDVFLLWSLRCALVVQSMLEEKSATLYNNTKLLFDQFKGCGDEELKPLILLEEAKFNYLYHYIRECEVATSSAAASVGLKIEDTGALGKRTKFQVKELPQFTLDVEESSSYKKQSWEPVDKSYLAEDLQLNDEVRLEAIEFQDKERERVREMDALQQSCVLARYFLKERNLPVDDISWQELTPHLSLILQHPVSWPIHSVALFNRCKLETKSRRTIERARAQLETILETYLKNIPRKVFMDSIYISRLPPKWKIEKELGSILLQLGATKAALDVFLKLESWDEVIVCYNLLQLRHKSAQIIKQRLEERETPRLWCQLGDATDDIKCYEKALELSKNKSARANKSLGLYYYYRKEYSASIEHFQRSLDCSRFQLDVMLRLGFAAMECEQWGVAAQAYRDYCSLESDNFEAWNNLANCYIKMSQKERAWRVLQEAVRCDYDNWKVWDNLMVISVDLGAFDEAIRAYNRILDIKQTHIDDQVLQIMTESAISGIKDSAGDSSVKYRPQMVKLVARITVALPKEPVPWSCYGRLLINNSDSDTSAENQVKGCQYLQKSLAAYTAKKGWDKDIKLVTHVLKTSCRLVSGVLNVQSEVQQLQVANSARLSLVSSFKMVERSQTSIKSGNLPEEIQQLYTDTKADIDSLLQRIEDIKAAS
eukprot:TRINITY_DN2746_c0_g1_i1.p1 TRINITY_DN2746_c0_g1~~TRINITY_DN2746_c0_g1_i1.p1  ORF type:complete len:795 (+),score=158.23 TRINITY_DN2746_c0_g1_i1:68-2452(+)